MADSQKETRGAGVTKGKAAKQTWRNRIVGHDVKPASWFLANEENWRIHPKKQQEATEGVLDEVGWVQDVMVNKRTSSQWADRQGVETLVDGHMRVLLALKVSDDEPVPLEYVDLTPDEERKVLLTLDPLAAMAAADKEKLDGLLREVSSESAAVQAMLAEIAEKEGIRLGRELPAPEAQIDKAAELQEKWQVTTGSVWEAGAQRLICGDCTDRATVDRLMRGEKAGALITDPPWNVGWDYGGYKDNLTVEEYREFSAKWYAIVAPFLEDAWCFVAQSMRNYKHLGSWFPQAERLFAECQNFVQHTPEGMQYACNPFLIWRVGNPQIMPRAGRRDWFLAETSNTRPSGDKSLAKLNSATRWPPTIEYLIDNWGRDNILDPFLGSGTTLVACARLGRRGRGIEIYAPYVSVALQRLQDMGLEVKRVE